MCLRDVSTSHHNSSSSHALSQQPPCFLPYPTWRNRGPFFSRSPCSYKASKQDLLPSWKYQLSYIPLGSPLRCSWDWENGHCSCVTHPPQLSTSKSCLPTCRLRAFSLSSAGQPVGASRSKQCHRFRTDLPVPECANSIHWGRKKMPVWAACPDHSLYQLFNNKVHIFISICISIWLLYLFSKNKARVNQYPANFNNHNLLLYVYLPSNRVVK